MYVQAKVKNNKHVMQACCSNLAETAEGSVVSALSNNCTAVVTLTEQRVCRLMLIHYFGLDPFILFSFVIGRLRSYHLDE